MKQSAILLIIVGMLLCVIAGHTDATEVQYYGKKYDIRSAYEILDIDHLERIECDREDVFYIRSVIAYHEYEDPANRKRYDGKAATYLNGIYQYDGRYYLPLCEIKGDHEKNGFGELHKKNSGGGEFNQLVELKTYYKYFHGKSKQFLIELRWTPYRGENSTLYVFDSNDFSKPILNLSTSRIEKLEKVTDGRYEVEVNRWPEPNSRFFLVYDKILREYVVEDEDITQK